VADYLLQHASRERLSAQVPASTWDALLSHLRDPADAARLADIANDELLHRYAIPLYRRAAAAGDQTAAWMLAELLADPDQAERHLRARANVGDEEAARLLAGLLARRSQVEEASNYGGSA
jgi:TPR repeat protein